MTRRQPRPPRAPQAGSISAMTPLLALTVLALVGLAYDGGNAITAHRRAINLAEQAGRAGAQQLDIATLRRDGTYRLDRPAAQRAAAAYLDAAGQHGQLQVASDQAGDYVQVTVSWRTPAVFARLLGRSQFTGTGTALARNCHGLVTEEAC